MSTVELLNKIASKNSFSIDDAREFIQHDRMEVVGQVPENVRQEVDSLYLFAEGFIHEVEEGFVSSENDPELLSRTRSIIRSIDP